MLPGQPIYVRKPPAVPPESRSKLPALVRPDPAEKGSIWLPDYTDAEPTSVNYRAPRR